MRYICFFCLVLLLSGCSSDDNFEPVYNVPEEFQPIVDTFLAEARARGHEFQINNLIIAYDDELEIRYCGTCNSNSMSNDIQKIISINSRKCWINDAQKEALIFHELGHCFLGREHDDTKLPNGDPKSMMVEDNLSIYSPCVYVFGNNVDCNFTYKRTYYIDELFDENTSIPDWAE